MLDRLVAEARMYFQPLAIVDNNNCKAENNALLLRWILPVVATLTGVLGLFFVHATYNRIRHRVPILTKVGVVGLVMVVAAYSTELLFFLGVVRRRQHLGDFAVLQTILSAMKVGKIGGKNKLSKSGSSRRLRVLSSEKF